MAKSFLDTLDDGVDDQFLSDLIPDTRKPRQASAKKPAATASSRKASRSRKKSFLQTIEQNISERTPKRVQDNSPDKSRKKSFLETIEEAYDQSAFDDLIPDRNWSRKSSQDFTDDHTLERKFGSILTPEVLKRVKEIAAAKGIGVEDVIRRALELYVQKEG